MKKIILLLTLVVILVGNSFGQDAKYKAALTKMMEVSGSSETYKMAIKQMMVMFKEQKMGVPEKFWNELETEFLATSLDELMELIAPVYFKHMTQADIEALIAFYQTPVGKKYAEKSPLIAQESMEAGQTWGKAIGEKVMKKLQDEGY